MPIIQQVETVTGAVASGTTIIPENDTIPQITEGNEYMTLAITPIRPGSTLKIDVVCQLTTSASSAHMVAALFQDALLNALKCGVEGTTSGNMVAVVFSYKVASGGTTLRTYRVRGGASGAGTTTFNGRAGARRYGGVLASSIIITEVE